MLDNLALPLLWETLHCLLPVSSHWLPNANSVACFSAGEITDLFYLHLNCAKIAILFTYIILYCTKLYIVKTNFPLPPCVFAILWGFGGMTPTISVFFWSKDDILYGIFH